ncbi:hypothetical protein [Roseovarius aestuariivivens]|uniref:hypothetical protein n=1 Tax=Roseovarius aestuariivivens TaxID=1888910 RepID=UPI00108021E9|nr:hypothetical protein [Roseovarius aestuariivivens]
MALVDHGLNVQVAPIPDTKLVQPLEENIPSTLARADFPLKLTFRALFDPVLIPKAPQMTVDIGSEFVVSRILDQSPSIY